MSKGNSNIKKHIFINEDFKIFKEALKAAKFKPIDEKNLYIAVQKCTVFGCGKTLTLMEKLCGCRCFDHMKRKGFMFHGNW